MRTTSALRDYSVSFQVSVVSYLGECLLEPCLLVAKSEDTFGSLLKRISSDHCGITEWTRPKCECSDPRSRGYCNVALSMRITDISRRHGFTVIKFTVAAVTKRATELTSNNENGDEPNHLIALDSQSGFDSGFTSAEQTPLRRLSGMIDIPNAGMRHRLSSGDFIRSSNSSSSNGDRLLFLSNDSHSSTSPINSNTVGDRSSRMHFLRVTDSTAEEGSGAMSNNNNQRREWAKSSSSLSMKNKGGYYEKLAIVSRYKRFRKRKSALNALMENDMGPLYFISLTGLIVLMTATLVDDLINSSVGLWSSISLIAWNFRDLSWTLQLWLAMQVYVYCSLLPIHLYWSYIVGGSTIDDKLDPSILVSLSSMLLGPLLYFPVVWCFDYDLPFSCAMIIVCEQVRFLLKSSAFVIEHWRTHSWLLQYLRALKKKNDEKDDGNQQLIDGDRNSNEDESSNLVDAKKDEKNANSKDDDHCRATANTKSEKDESDDDDDEKSVLKNPTTLTEQPSSSLSMKSDDSNVISMKSVFDVDIYSVQSMEDLPVPPYLVSLNLSTTQLIQALTYFLFAPTLVYRTRYPRTARVDWLHALTNLRDVFLTMAFVWVIFVRFCIPVHRQSIENPGDFSQLFSEFVNCSVPGLLLLVVGFYGVLHCWMNFFAEILTFADREFYKDWWNSRSFAQYYRRWNCVVHDWIYNYMYLPALENGCGKTLSMLLVFVTSAIIHEYVLWVALKFFYPVLLVLFGGVGVFFIPLTSMYKNAQGWNVFMWSNLLIGQGMLVVLYSREWFAQYDENALKYVDVHSAMPRSWQLIRYHYAHIAAASAGAGDVSAQ